MKKTRSIQYYRLIMNRKESGISIDNNELKNVFDSMVQSQMKPVPGTAHRVALFITRKNTFYIELASQDEFVYYLKLGIRNPNKSVELRNTDTLESKELDLGNDQNLEIYTFCVIDFRTSIVCYVAMNGSPRASIVKEWINDKCQESGIEAHLAAIVSKDVIKILSSKKRVLRIELDVAVPSDDILEEIGVPESTFDGLRGQKMKTLKYTLKAERGKSIFESKEMIPKLVQNLLDSVPLGIVRSLNAFTKDEGEINPQIINLLEEGVTVQDYIERNDYDNAEENAKLKMIFNKYRCKKDYLLSCIQE